MIKLSDSNEIHEESSKVEGRTLKHMYNDKVSGGIILEFTDGTLVEFISHEDVGVNIQVPSTSIQSFAKKTGRDEVLPSSGLRRDVAEKLRAPESNVLVDNLREKSGTTVDDAIMMIHKNLTQQDLNLLDKYREANRATAELLAVVSYSKTDLKNKSKLMDMFTQEMYKSEFLENWKTSDTVAGQVYLYTMVNEEGIDRLDLKEWVKSPYRITPSQHRSTLHLSDAGKFHEDLMIGFGGEISTSSGSIMKMEFTTNGSNIRSSITSRLAPIHLYDLIQGVCNGVETSDTERILNDHEIRMRLFMYLDGLKGS